MTAAHTPGPWVVAGPEAASGPGYVMTRGGTYIAKPLINNEANARLIAAAPELLDALEAALAHFGPFAEITINGQRDPDDVRVTALIRAAIAKATGAA